MQEDFLLHSIIGADVEHINIAKRVEGKVAEGGDESAGQVEAGAFFVAGRSVICVFPKPRAYPKKDEQDMPQVRMYGERGVAVM